MIARITFKSLPTALAVVCALIAAPTSARAQDGSEWQNWRGPRPQQAPPETAQPYDGRVDDQYDETVEPQYQRRYDNRRYDDERVYDERNDRRRRFDNRRYDRRQFEDRPFDDRDDDTAPADTAREPESEAEQNKITGADGGPRPGIQPTAPPVVGFNGSYAPGSIVIDTSARKLYYVTSPTIAFAYPIGVGREGFSWTGSEKVSRLTDWPDWYPPAEMRKRKPELPERMLGGLNNPLGAKAIYLGNTLYRIHGTNDPKSIGKAESSGCFRMLNNHVLHLASRVQVGTQVSVVKSLNRSPVAAKPVIAKPVAAKPVVAKRVTAKPAPRPRVVQRSPQWQPRPRRSARDYDPYYDDYDR
jgi:lipoprotein-anchoring transpeptidase ErfK/SrfK